MNDDQARRIAEIEAALQHPLSEVVHLEDQRELEELRAQPPMTRSAAPIIDKPHADRDINFATNQTVNSTTNIYQGGAPPSDEAVILTKAQALLDRLPLDTIPELASLPSASRMPLPFSVLRSAPARSLDTTPALVNALHRSLQRSSQHSSGWRRPLRPPLHTMPPTRKHLKRHALACYAMLNIRRQHCAGR
jgi:hypothetical protein